jgi:DNA-directed RNA polymerase II subunit RPB1
MIKTNNPSKIIGIQFSLMSPEEIRKGSVAEITSRDTYVNNKPIIGGIFDPRMGVLEPGLICPTDGLDYMQTPGYHGHVNLPKPVFYIQYITTVQKILRCVCFKCSKLSISKEKHKQALNLNEYDRWKYVFSVISKIKRCGEDITDGCGCLRPTKLRKEGLATIYAEWKTPTDTMTIKVTAEMVLKIFKRISDEDISFMGFSPIWSRPSWMICEVLLIPPPAVRPSVKHDAQQRSEDDLSHILVSIIKTIKTLQEKIQNNAPPNIIDDWTTVLQYYVATLVDNKIPGVASVAQRSGRPLKSIKDRLNGKGGRMRGNLMAKRVDFSARSVITGDPNISIRELGIPMKIAKNITKPVIVNDMNREFLMKLVLNGPDVHPGAKILDKKGGDSITLRYADKSSIILENGDIVHRHIMDGDAVLFNRQPTLHRMSMMCHIARVMTQGDTFRMNVGCTKPYNADFDGDEMNLHMPQDSESETELKQLAAVPFQIISPANNASIIGIFQDSMIGCFRFTRENILFTPREAMNLLSMFKRVNEDVLNEQIKTNNGYATNFDILSQIMPSLTLYVKTKLYKDTQDAKTSNHIIEIKDGKYIRGQIVSATTKTLIQRVCNDFGNMNASNFIDDLQNIITKYLKVTSFSVGISDLISNEKTKQSIITIIDKKKNDVKNIIDQTQIGIFENNTGKTNEEEFETQINNILNQATADSGKIGLESLDKNNRFVTMVNAGSKGSDLNITFMISCLGQQNIDGKRIPYGFDNRTLPHYTKFDDSPNARGFVESSYINGLTPQELFFHAMGGRVGLIDTAVKTSSTGYIQRRLIKGLEDLMVFYDMTVRSSKNKIVQFLYGEDGIDPIKVENQNFNLTSMSNQDIYAHYNIPDNINRGKLLSEICLKEVLLRYKTQEEDTQDKLLFYTNMMIENRDKIIKYIFKYKDNNLISCPVAFQSIINNVIGQQNISINSMIDLTILEALTMIEDAYDVLNKIRITPPTELFKTLFYFHLSPKELLFIKRVNKNTLSIILQLIILAYKKSIVAPGEMVGMIAAQSIGEPTTQLTLNTFHFSGVSSKSNVTRGVPRIEEILSLSSDPKNPSLTVYLKEEDETEREKAQTIQYMLEHTRLKELVKSIEICFDPDDMNTMIQEDKELIAQYKEFEVMVNEAAGCVMEQDNIDKSKWIVRMELNPVIMFEKNITMDDINFVLNNTFTNITCIFSDYNSDKLIFRIRINNILKGTSMTKTQKKQKIVTLDQSDQIYLLKNFQEELLENVVVKGIKHINKVILRKIKDNVFEDLGKFVKKDIWVLDTIGTNMLDVLALPYIDNVRTFSNDIIEMHNILGIEAVRQVIYNEIAEVIEFDGTYINYHHLAMLCDRMTYTYKLISIFRHGINNDNIGPIAKASFEETPEMFLKAARHGELDNMRGVSSNIMCGQEGLYGTNCFQLVLNMEEVKKLESVMVEEKPSNEELIQQMFQLNLEDSNNVCNIQNMLNNTGISNIKTIDLGKDSGYIPEGF